MRSGYISVPSVTLTGKGGTSEEECPAGSRADKDICRPCEGNTYAPKGAVECTPCNTPEQPCAYSSKDRGTCLPQGEPARAPLMVPSGLMASTAGLRPQLDKVPPQGAPIRRLAMLVVHPPAPGT